MPEDPLIPTPEKPSSTDWGDGVPDGGRKFADLIAQRFFGFENEKAIVRDGQIYYIYRYIFDGLLTIFSNPEDVINRITSNKLTYEEKQVLNATLEAAKGDREFIASFVSSYQSIVKENTDYSNADIQTQGLAIELMLQTYAAYKEINEVKANEEEQWDYIRDALTKISGNGDQFEPSIDYLDSYQEVKDIFRNGKFRDDVTPTGIAPWQCRIGGSTFYIPPVNINVSQVFRAGSMGGGIRQHNTMKFNTGHSETTITMTLYFPNHETIWGFKGDTAQFNWDPQVSVNKERERIAYQSTGGEMTSDAVIDYFLSSLRGLVTQFKYSPFLPIKNQYLNQTYNIQAVTMLDLTIQTVPEFPFCLVATLTMAKFNHKAYLPMIEDFDNAIHWGKFRQYMGRAAARLDAYVNQGFLTSTSSLDPLDEPNHPEMTGSSIVRIEEAKKRSSYEIVQYEGDLIPAFNKVKDIDDGRFFNIYYPKTTPSRIFSPDDTDFRQPGEDLVVSRERWDFIANMLGLEIVDRLEFDFFEFDQAFKNYKLNSERYILRTWLKTWQILDAQLTKENMDRFIEETIANGRRNGSINDSNEAYRRSQLKFTWYLKIYESLKTNSELSRRIEQARSEAGEYVLNEWLIPMNQLIIDWDKCIINGVSVSMSNNIARLQLQMQDEPVHQHVGGGDTRVDVSMFIIGEDNLIRFRRIFEHIGGLARLEQGHGVLGFLGIKNVITSLCGVKYVLPLNFEVDTIPDFPHVYEVKMSFIDFDVMQQKREKLSMDQQLELVRAFGKRNPFLRMKQLWGAFNAYPDLPLDVKNEDNKTVGHLDPDWYFRSFVTNDDDIFSWDTKNNLRAVLASLRYIYENMPDQVSDEYTEYQNAQKSLSEQAKKLIEEMKTELPEGFKYNSDGRIIFIGDTSGTTDEDEPVISYKIGAFGEDQNKIDTVTISKSGAISLGEFDLQTGVETPFIGEHVFSEDLASKNLLNTSLFEGLAALPHYQKEYIDGSDNPTAQYEAIMKDWRYRNTEGRMLPAFPTYMLWLIDEGGKFAGVKLFDNFYGLSSVVDFSVLSSEDSMNDTLVLKVSNLYQRLTTPFSDALIAQDDPLAETPTGRIISTWEDRTRNLRSGLTDDESGLVEINNIRLKPGVRVHLRLGYGSNVNRLQTVFNGTITQVEQGDILTIIAQSDATELGAIVNNIEEKGDTGAFTSQFNTGLWLAEPRDMMVRILSMGSSVFKEWVAWGSKGTIFSENKFGIRHFGSILYEPMNTNEKVKTMAVTGFVKGALDASAPGQPTTEASFIDNLQGITEEASSLTMSSFAALYNENMIAIMKALWLNQFKKRDYEIFKRNIYPGNGLGIAQYMAGDMIDAGMILSTNVARVTAKVKQETSGPASESTASAGTGTSTDNENVMPPPPQPSVTDVAEYNKRFIEAVRGLGEYAQEDDSALIDLINSNTFIPSSDYEVEDDPSLLESVAADIAGGVGWVGSWLAGSYIPGVGLLGRPIYSGMSWLLDKFSDNTGDVNIFGIDVSEIISIAYSAGSLAFDVASNMNPFRLANSSLFKNAFFAQDDDLPGYDEVSFRAQTYMKSVWELFQLCAALLPNYIVAVRPFEDRSTVFYGKPHWLYTSGLIPVSSGVPRNGSPKIDVSDRDEQELIALANKGLNSFEEVQRTLSDAMLLNKDFVSNAIGMYSSVLTNSMGKPIAYEKIKDLKTDWADGAFIPMAEGAVSLEMHLPTSQDINIDIANQVPGNAILPPERQHPFYMDRIGGWRGGEDPPNGWGVPGVDPSIAKEPAELPGQTGAFGYLTAEEERWYISSFWPYDNKAKYFRDKGYTEIADKINANPIPHGKFKSRRVLIWAEKTNKAVICAIGEWGPHIGKFKADGVDFCCGISPETAAILGVVRGDKVVLRAFEGKVNLGPVESFGINIMGADVLPNVPVTGQSGIGEDTTQRAKTIEEWQAAVEEEIKQQIFASSGQEGGVIPGSIYNRDTLAAQKSLELLRSDPMIFAYHFGWKYKSIPAYIDPTTGFGYDVVGSNARSLYDEDFDEQVDILPNASGRSVEDAQYIWETFRREYRGLESTKQIFVQRFPTESDERFNDIFDLFLRFMWQVPSNRAWLAINTGINEVNRGTTPLDPSDPSTETGTIESLDWKRVDEVWGMFLSARDLAIIDGIPQSNTLVQWMLANTKQEDGGKSLLEQGSDALKKWFDANIGQILGTVGDLITGFTSVIRMSMHQMGIGLGAASQMQKQANILNKVFNDSIYYSEGAEGSLLRLVDNPFTREYGEPVIEIREPFQRVHFLSSFNNILNNGISENLSGVPTMVTALSDGKYPTTVHFDKGMPPDRQLETTVETGLFWDNAVGSGLTGLLHPLLHPFETFRSVQKTFGGSSDLLSARRVALYHLKEGLKDIYKGELLILGNSEIRPHDLIFIADIYEKMYGMFEVEQVVHHFTPDMGFVTSITPNAIVTVNDPARWSMISWMWRKWADYNMRHDTRVMMGVNVDRSVSKATAEPLTPTNVPLLYNTQMIGATQFTQGNTALVKDISTYFNMGGVKGLSKADERAEQVAKWDLQLRAGLAAETAASAAAGVVAGLAAGPVVGGAVFGAGYAIGDLTWKAWTWVKDNLLDQHGCYIQYLNKDGQPMDAGLSYAQGVAVGQHHSINLFPSILGISSRLNTREEGHYRLTTNDLLSALGWTEVETAFLHRDLSWFINNINKDILKLAGRGPTFIQNEDYYVVIAQVLDPIAGEDTPDGKRAGVIDADTLDVRILSGAGPVSAGSIERIRLAVVNAYELDYYPNAETEEDELLYNRANDLARMGAEYIRGKFADSRQRIVALRIDKRTPRDSTQSKRLVATVFHNTPAYLGLNISQEERIRILTSFAERSTVSWDSYLEDGRPYTLNWELVMTGFGNVDMRDSLWNSPTRQEQYDDLYQG